jgi:maltose O-acetyltransferase
VLPEFEFLWKNRERPNKLKRWFIVWIKRSLQIYPLLHILVRVYFFRFMGANIGKLTTLGKARFQGHLVNLKIGDQVSLGCCEIALHDVVSIERCAVISDGVVLLTASHSITDLHWKQKKSPIKIGEYAWIATNAIILPGVTIGRGAVVGAGAVVREDVSDFAVVIGNPCITTKVERSKELNYSPVLLNAPYEAWIGYNIHNVSKQQ